jgi:protein O-mannosyl-transferase
MSVRPAPHRAKPASVRAPRAAALVAGVALCGFLPTLRAGFVYDDALLIANNPSLREARSLLSAFTGHFFEGIGAQDTGLTYYRPLVTVSLVLNGLLFGPAAWGYHLVNLLLHACSAWLATRVALRWLERPWLAVLVGVLFAVHPTRTESVAWIVGRTDILMSLFGLLSVELLHRARRATGSGNVVLGLTSLAAALLCKEGAVFLPVLLAADALRDEPGGLSSRTRRHLAAGVALSAFYLTARWLVFPVRTAPSALLPAYGLMTVTAYVERLFWPWPQTFFYRSLLAGPSGPEYPPALVIAGAALSLGYGLLTWRCFRRDRAAGVCLVAALSCLAPVLNFYETGIYFTECDHYLYLPLFLLVLGLARAMRAELGPIRDTMFAWAALAIALLSAVPNTLRARDFRSDAALWRRELTLDPNNPIALDALASVEAAEGRIRSALALLERAEGPAAQRRVLLAAAGRVGRRLQRLSLIATSTPDGDAAALSLLYAELRSFYAGKPSGTPATVRRLSVGVEQGQASYARTATARGKNALAAELATLATRLGRWEEARQWLARVEPRSLELLPNPLSLVLAKARLAEYPDAFAALERLGELGSAAPGLDASSLERLGRRLLRSQEHWIAARHAAEPRAAMFRALAALELGGYLSACRELRPAYLATPGDPELAQLYTQALLSARLDAAANEVVGRSLPPDAAARVLASLRSQLPADVREAEPAPDQTWWD